MYNKDIDVGGRLKKQRCRLSLYMLYNHILVKSLHFITAFCVNKNSMCLHKCYAEGVDNVNQLAVTV